MKWIAIILTVLFAILKSQGTVDWSWWIVCLPVLIWAGLYLLVTLISLVFAGVLWNKM